MSSNKTIREHDDKIQEKEKRRILHPAGFEPAISPIMSWVL